MKRSILVFSLIVGLAGVVMAQQAPGRGPGPGGPGAGAGRGPGGGGPGGGGRGRGAPAPPATGPIADMVNKIVELVNKQDTEGHQQDRSAGSSVAR